MDLVGPGIFPCSMPLSSQETVLQLGIDHGVILPVLKNNPSGTPLQLVTSVYTKGE